MQTPSYPALLAATLGTLMFLQAQSQAHAQTPAQVRTQPKLRVTGYGYSSVSREVGIRTPTTADGGNDPVKTVEDARIIRRTDHIEARLCRRFGLSFVLEGAGDDGTLDITVETRHPPTLNPHGQVSTGTRYSASIEAGHPAWVGYTFDFPFELVPGTWSFALLSAGNVLIEQQFEVTVPPDVGQQPAGGCAVPVS